MSEGPRETLDAPPWVGALDSIVFDLDGTLWDTSEVCSQAWNRALAILGLEGHVTAADIGSIMGLTHEHIFPKLFPALPEAQRELLSQECYRQEAAFIESQGGRLYEGVAEGLQRLAAELPLYIVSNCQCGYIELFLRATGLGPCFQDFECHGNTGKSKAHNISQILERNRLTCSVYVGDTLSDASAAQAAGLPFLFMEYGFGHCDRAHMRFAGFVDLVSWILSQQRVGAA